jgi:glutamyl-tRNA synthetase
MKQSLIRKKYKMSIVTRFPPSPTGFLHIGGARTALFNWAFAKANGGKMLMRVEDTDKTRSTPEAVQAILDGMAWLNLDHDGEIVYQTQNEHRHIEVAKQLLAEGKAYHCYCSPEELSEMREKGHGYDRKWRDNDSTPPEGIKPVIRIKAPIDGEITIHDKVQGDVTIPAGQLDDFIILRSDGTPTYMLAVVVDDYDMGITHVIRGDDHLTNTFRQKVIIDAMGWDLPIYAHMPMIHGDDGAKLSKRHGALSVTEYDDMGYLPDAMVNYLARLGWSHGDDEIFSREQLIEWFTLEGINKSPARMDFKKLDDVNQYYIHHMDDADLVNIILNRHDAEVTPDQKSWLLNGMSELKLRAVTLNDLVHDALIYIAPVTYEEKANNAIENGQDALKALYNAFTALNDFTAESVEKSVKDIVNEFFDGKYGKVGMPLRAALTGRGQSPSVPNIAASLGKDETLKRIQNAIQ